MFSTLVIIPPLFVFLFVFFWLPNKTTGYITQALSLKILLISLTLHVFNSSGKMSVLGNSKCAFSLPLRPLYSATIHHTNLKAVATIKFKVSNFVFAPNIAEQPFISFINFLILFTTLLKKFPITYTSDSPTSFLTLRR